MDEMPIEASVDEFIDAVVKATGERVVCSACGNEDWAIWDAAPLTLHVSNLRPNVPFEDSEFGIHAVAFSCTRCGLVRFHSRDVAFPPEQEEAE